MKVLFYSSGTLMYQFISVLLDDAISYSKEGHEVYFVYNDCLTGVCTYNLESNSDSCEKCHRKMKKSLTYLPKSIKSINVNSFYEKEADVRFAYDTIQDLKALEYKNVKIGYSVLSSYITITRNIAPVINNETRPFWDKLLAASCRLTDALEKAIDTIKPDLVCFFNTRCFEWRPPYDLAIARGIDVVSLERSNDKSKPNVKDRFVNMTPHSIKGNQSRCEELWDKSDCSLEEKCKIGESFFNHRRSGIETNDRVYIGMQKQNLLPKDWDDTKRNIVIFNSSEDEYASIGIEYEQLKLFPSQYQGIRYILDTLSLEKDIHVYLRIHPNLAKVPYRYHTELSKLSDEYKNATIIPALDPVSTYALMDAAEKVIVFGSTMGIEAAYWRKPVILLAGACYYYSNLCYIPKTKEELRQLLFSELPPKDNQNAIKWGYYFMHRDPQNRSKYIDIDAHIGHIGKFEYTDVHYLKLFGSSRLYALWYKLLHKLSRRKVKISDIPTEEDMDAAL